MTGILFWNTHRNADINKYIIDAVAERGCDIVVLAEYVNDTEELCNELLITGKNFKPLPFSSRKRIKIVSNSNYTYEPLLNDQYVSINNASISGKTFIIAALHFPSKLYSGEDEREALAVNTITEVKKAAELAGHSNIIIIGDFNANPFEKVCIGAGCFHAVPSKKDVQARTRIVNGIEYEMYYNPMWNMFGDFNKPAGTYWYNNSGKITNYYWNIFDQVIFSVDAAKAFESESLEIINTIGGTPLLNQRGVPDVVKISDHLPVFFNFKEEMLDA